VYGGGGCFDVVVEDYWYCGYDVEVGYYVVFGVVICV